ncbi:MAG: aminomethyl-transferring glycine dehydrogenase subunit GcvPA [Tissierellia bacterium]|nr:aminomethyl-transferring glycine dehydrogenase subunit GcvPA [Tissierellia bacterium]
MIHRYIPKGDGEKEKMLETIGLTCMDDLFADIPDELRLKEPLDIPPAMSEIELLRHARKLGEKNSSLSTMTSFLGAGVYDHFVPLIIDHIISRSEFYTAYTPYQPEISQGTLQAIFEYQTLICRLTGMDISNASMYDGASAAAEALLIALSDKRKSDNVLISEGVHPQTLRVIRTYLHYRNVDIRVVPLKEGKTDLNAAKELVDEKTAGMLVQNPNFFGTLDDVSSFSEFCSDNKMVSVLSVDPISLALLEAPGKLGIDLVVGDGQSLGNGHNFGGPHFGFLAVKKKYMRKIPGRLVGISRDTNGKRAYVLTLQAREQHIRRHRATSNICSNMSLNALTASIYLNTLGKSGFREVASQSLSKAHYLYNGLLKTGAFQEVDSSPFFKEFRLKYNGCVGHLLRELRKRNILGGVDLGEYGHEGEILVAVTEKRTKEEMDQYIACVKEASA